MPGQRRSAEKSQFSHEKNQNKNKLSASKTEKRFHNVKNTKKDQREYLLEFSKTINGMLEEEVNRYKSLRISFTLAVLTFSKMFIASNQMDAERHTAHFISLNFDRIFDKIVSLNEQQPKKKKFTKRNWSRWSAGYYYRHY